MRICLGSITTCNILYAKIKLTSNLDQKFPRTEPYLIAHQNSYLAQK